MGPGTLFIDYLGLLVSAHLTSFKKLRKVQHIQRVHTG